MTTDKQIYNVGIYCRLSKDDGTDSESASIGTQKSILTEYVNSHGWRLIKTYVDDGYSGTNFNRPDFQNMLRDIEKGLINCVITKDLSRLGRNYLDCGLYLEVFFPEHSVRYIAVNDSVDTLNKAAMDITPFRNILNEMYSADVSMKIKSAYKVRFHQGKFMATTAPYGYRKDPENRNHLLIDEQVAPVVRKMFDLALAGDGIEKIRKYLNSRHILRPSAYAEENGYSGYERYFEDFPENRYIWSENSVRGVLRNPVYAGNLAGYKRPIVSMKSKKRLSRLPEEWETVNHTHVGIITQEEFDTVQKLMTRRRKETDKYGFDNVFLGVLKCADCGYAMRATCANRRKRPELIDCIQYCCNNYGRYGNINCTSHTIEARDLTEAVLADINHFAALAKGEEKAVMAIRQRLNSVSDSEAKASERERRSLERRLGELDRLFATLYEDRAKKKISEHNYNTLSAKYDQEQLQADVRLKEIDAELIAKGMNDRGAQDFVSLIQNYAGLTELTAPIVNALIDRITISERKKNPDGTMEQHIRIYYKFVGALNEATIHCAGRMTCFTEDKTCAKCGAAFRPNSNAAKYCPDCSEKMHGQQSNESKIRSRTKAKISAA